MEEERTMLEEEQEQEQRDTFTITDDKSAEWAIKKIKEAEREQNRLLALIDEERADLDIREKQIADQYDNRTSHLKELLQSYVQRVYENGDANETKTQIAYPLLSGKLVLKKPSTKLQQDDKVLTEWCRSHLPERVKTTYKADWAEIKKNVKVVDGIAVYEPTGEVMSGVTEQPVAPELKIVW